MCGCKLDNDLPNRPDNPSPSNFARDLAINQKLQWSGGDPQGEIVKYIIYFDSHWPSTTKIAEVNSTSLNVSFNISNLSYNTDYYWRVNAIDGLSPYVEGPSWSFTTEEKPNSPPEKPSMPSGSNNGLEYKSYDYSTTTTDPDKDSVKYNFSWGDGNFSETSLINSGTIVNVPHNWGKWGTYHVRVKAVDENGEPSDWSEALEVIINANSQPSRPKTPFPKDGDINIPINTTIKWSCVDPDGDTIEYTLFMDNRPDPKAVKYEGTDSHFGRPPPYLGDFIPLDYETTYYWKVAASDGRSPPVESPVWKFTTKAKEVLQNQLITVVVVSVPGSEVYVDDEVEPRGKIAEKTGELSIKVSPIKHKVAVKLNGKCDSGTVTVDKPRIVLTPAYTC